MYSNVWKALLGGLCLLSSGTIVIAGTWKQTIELSERLQAEGRLGDAEKLLVSRLESDSANQNLSERAYLFNNLGSVYQDQCRYLEAERSYRRALLLWGRAGGDWQLPLARTLNNLASLLFETGKLGEAEKLLLQSSAIHREALGSDHQETASVFFNLGAIRLRQQQYAKAETAYRQAIAIWEKQNITRELEIARVAGSLGTICRKTGRRSEASSYFGRAQTIWERHVALGERTPELLLDLARSYSETNQQDRAEPLLKNALVSIEKQVGPDHPKVVAILYAYAALMHGMHRKSEARELENRAKKIQISSPQLHLALETVGVSDLRRSKE
jgi:tetratricopeptide (TPR) repeat protein